MKELLLAALAASAQPSFDCAKAATRVETLICADEELVTLDQEIGRRWGALPASDRDWMLPDQRRWERRVGEMCPQPNDRKATLCLRDQYARWVQWLGVPAASPARARTEMRWSRKSGYTVDMRFPEIPDARFTAFNAWAAAHVRETADRQAAQWDGAADEPALGLSEALLGFALPLLSDRFVTVDFEGYAYNKGAAHGLPWSESVLFDLGHGRPVAAADLFPDGRWIAFAAEFAEAALRKDLGGAFWGKPAELRRLAADIRLWSFRRGEAVITFPVYAVASYADGPQTVTIPYDRLAPFLKPGATLPR